MKNKFILATILLLTSTSAFASTYHINLLDRVKFTSLEEPEIASSCLGDENYNITGEGYNGSSLYSVNETELRNLVGGQTYCVDGYRIDTYADSMIDTSQITDMSHLFLEKFVEHNIENWNVSNVENMRGMFMDSAFFNQDISNWQVYKVRDFRQMFLSASSFNQDISNWIVENSYDPFEDAYLMDDFLNFATSFNQDLSGLCVFLSNQKPPSFDSNTPSWTLPKPSFGSPCS